MGWKDRLNELNVYVPFVAKAMVAVLDIAPEDILPFKFDQSATIELNEDVMSVTVNTSKLGNVAAPTDIIINPYEIRKYALYLRRGIRSKLEGPEADKLIGSIVDVAAIHVLIEAASYQLDSEQGEAARGKLNHEIAQMVIEEWGG